MLTLWIDSYGVEGWKGSYCSVCTLNTFIKPNRQTKDGDFLGNVC